MARSLIRRIQTNVLARWILCGLEGNEDVLAMQRDRPTSKYSPSKLHLVWITEI